MSLLPADRSAALLYAQGLLRSGDAPAAAALLMPLAVAESDPAFLRNVCRIVDALRPFGRRACGSGPHDESGGWIGGRSFSSWRMKYMRAGKEEGPSICWAGSRKSMLAARRESEFALAVINSSRCTQNRCAWLNFCSAMYGELNRESKVFRMAWFGCFDLRLAR